MRIWFNPRRLGLRCGDLLIGWAAINAFLLARSVRQNIVRLQQSTAAIPERHVGAIDPTYSDFDGLARAISLASDHVERALNDPPRAAASLKP